MAKRKTIFLVGADTGGHVVPIFALAKDFLEKSDYQVVVIGVGSKIEKEFYAKIPEAIYIKIVAGKFGKNFFSNILSVLKMVVGFVQSKFLVLKYQPEFIFLKGNYATIPIASAGRLFGIPVYCHESDAVIGRSNQIISRFAVKIFFSYPMEIYGYKKENGIYSGAILRQEFENAGEKKYDKIIQNQKLSTILVVGGSQGAHSINQAVFEILPALVNKFRIIHQTGRFDFESAKKIEENLSAEIRERYQPKLFIEKIDEVISSADLIISRASSAIFEFAAFQKPLILIPYPHAYNHQMANGKYFEKLGAAVVIADHDLPGKKLIEEINKLFSDQKKLKELAENLQKSAKTDGRKIVFEELMQKSNIKNQNDR
ncbi:MAG: UDP-N-acetylglucosamine--N-acetylmuramyl-(pentapeptide) pyrophosphoryl-undecaprenol N-acetylglucosamine transferase [Candidatus Berkelbacteria bacterium]|nr:UDP-N-acetylglucosamine--N-acetylmuramyl-(pentapeptide) pyrophosphoryl-undecaprenol N-acetylglucosamine transferase [Candidatus Berkelbacteria bacterium]